MQSDMWTFFKDCWQDPQAVAARRAVLEELDRWQRFCMGLDN